MIKIKRILNLYYCFNNIQLFPLTTFIIHILLINGKLTRTIKIMNRSTIWVFIYLLKRENYIET